MEVLEIIGVVLLPDNASIRKCYFESSFNTAEVFKWFYDL